MTFCSKGFVRFSFPRLNDEAIREFDHLVFDPYTGSQQRYRRFSQFKLAHFGHQWELEKLPHRPFIQAKSFNGLVGGLARHFEPIRFNPVAQVLAGAHAANFDKTLAYQLNVHQVRVLTDHMIKGVTVPEGPHRDGHMFVMNAIVRRKNITGGVTQLLPTGGGEPFFEDVLQENEAVILKDGDMWHHVTNILPTDQSPSFRDVLIITFNEWSVRRYGEEFERKLGLISSEVA